MRETLIYGLAFLLILGAGAFLILPRLGSQIDEPPVDEGPEFLLPDGSDPSAEDPGAVDPAPTTLTLPDKAVPLLAREAVALPESVRVRITGPGGPLRGALRPIAGATVLGDTTGTDDVLTLRIQPHGSEIAFGAVGHQWVRRGVGELADGMTITLPDAAPAVVVRVSEADGSPAVGVPVRVLPRSPGEMRRTDEGGTVVLDDLAPGNVVVDLTTRERTGPLLRLRTGDDREVEATLDPVWRVTGRVRAPGDKPVSGARVDVFSAAGPIGKPITTDATGRFTWTGPVVARASFRVHHAAWSEIAVEATPPATGDLAVDLGDVRFDLPGGALTVKVHSAVPAGATDAPLVVEVEPQVADAVRELFGSGQVLDRPRRLTAEDGGTVRFEGLPAGVPLRVSLRGAGIPVDGIAVVEAGEEADIVLAPPAGHVVAGIVQDPQGKPVPGVRVLVSRAPRDGDLLLAGDRVAHTGMGGGFQLFGEAGRTVFLRAYVPGYRGLLQRVELPLEKPLALTLEPPPIGVAHELTGRVRDETGTPLPGVTVAAAGVRTQTDAYGRFHLKGVATIAPILRVAYGYEPGPVAEGAPHPKTYGGRAFADVPGGTEKVLDLVLSRAVTVRLTAHDAADDAALTSLHVLARAPTGRILFDRPIATRGGAIELTGLTPFDHARVHAVDAEPRNPVRQGGMRLFLCTHDRRHQMEIPLEAGAVADLGKVLVKRGMHIKGRVTTPGGRPVPYARVAGMDAGWQSRGSDPEREREMAYRTTRADAEGWFTLKGFNPRRGANLVAWAPDRPPVAVNVILPPFSDKVDTEVKITLPIGTFLLLILEDHGTKRPIEGAMMDVEYAVDGEDYLDLLHHGAFAGGIGSTAEWRAASQLLLFPMPERGHYRLGPLRPGPYELWIEHPVYASERMRLTLPAKGETFSDTVSHMLLDRHGKRFRPKSSIAFEGSTLRLIIPMEGRR